MLKLKVAVTRMFLAGALSLALPAASTAAPRPALGATGAAKNPTALYDPGPGRTLLLIGQTYQQEFAGYVAGFGKAPAGSSHYGELYSGRINQGDDGKGMTHLGAVRQAYPCAYALVAISWKDNPDLSDHPIDACGRDFPGRRIYQVSRDISGGRYDGAIDSLAAIMRDNPSLRFLVRIEYEVSRYLFSWKDASRCPVAGVGVDFNDKTLIDDGAYRDAYNHIAARIRGKDGIGNVAFVFHPVRGPEDAAALYPGPENVDYIALSMFNNDVCIGAPGCRDSLDANVAKVFAWAKATAGKPLMIAESAPQPPATASDAGFVDYLDRLLAATEKFDVRVLTYINSDWNAHGWDARYWGDTRLETRPAVKAYWQKRVVEGARYVQYGCQVSAVPAQPQPSLSGSVVPTGARQAGGFRIEFQGRGYGLEGARKD